MKILISGASGLVGNFLVRELKNNNHEIFSLKRTKNLKKNEIFWDIKNKIIDLNEDSYFDVIIHLAGENIASGLWTKKRKEEISNSRILSTKLLVEKVLSLPKKPKLFIAASAIGYYGDRKEEELTELSSAGSGFLAKVCQDWEAATFPLRDAGVRKINARLGMILSKNGGALQKMLLPFKLGLGGNLGSGEQYLSWIALEDVIKALVFCIDQENISGAVNFTSPQPIRNKEFTKTLAQALARPAFFHVPGFILRLILGQMAEELLLSSIKAKPDVLTKNNYKFCFENLESYFQNI